MEMASSGKGTSFVKAKRMKGFISHLSSAASEWFLLFLLLLDALLSYMLTKFASYCRLQLPCLLCSRLDHILGCESPELYENLFCSNHKSEISSLILCHVHGKLANGHKMCDDCLLSVTAKTKSKSHRLLVGKFGLVLGDAGFKSPSLSRDLFAGSKGARLCTIQCTCCGKLWKSDQNSPRSIQLKSPGRTALKPYIPLPCAPRQSRLNHRDNMRKMRDKFCGLEGKNSFQPLSHVGYCELRLTSDSENEFPFSDDDDFSTSSVFQENIEASNDPMSQITLPPPTKCIPSNSNPENLSGSSAKPMPLSSAQCVEPNVSKHQDVNANSAVEINLQQTNQESFSSELAELISLDEVSSSPIVLNVPNRESEPEDSKITFPSQDSLPAPLSELMTLNGRNAHAGASSKKSADVAQASDTGMVSEKNGEVLEKIGTEEKISTETGPVVCDAAPTNPSQENSSNMNKFSVVTKEREETDFVTKQPTTEEVDTIKEEVEQSPLDNSSPNGSNLSSTFPVDHVDSPETHTEASSPNGVQVLQKSPSVESGLESLDDSNIAEIEGECYADKLRRHIDYYRKCLDSLLKELEEERNASAVATNEAMSMITRLQEEKAALQMEALQYLRMMEEQAEYDNDELEKVGDMLTEKEKEVQDLEAELEFYRSNMPGVEDMVHDMHKESQDLKGEKTTTQNTGVPNIIRKFSSSKNVEVSRVGDEAMTGGTFILEFEEEKEYISQCLKNLEQKVHEIYLHAPNDRPEKLEASSKSNQQGASNGEEHQLDGHEETDLSTQKNINMLNGNHIDKDGSAASDDCSLSVENKPTVSTPRRELELVVLENEISDLNDRLEALELNHELLEHLTNSLNSNDGKLFIQDIAHRLHELRKI